MGNFLQDVMYGFRLCKVRQVGLCGMLVGNTCSCVVQLLHAVHMIFILHTEFLP